MVSDVHLKYWYEFGNCWMSWDMFLIEHRRLTNFRRPRHPVPDLDSDVDMYMELKISWNLEVFKIMGKPTKCKKCGYYPVWEFQKD